MGSSHAQLPPPPGSFMLCSGLRGAGPVQTSSSYLPDACQCIGVYMHLIKKYTYCQAQVQIQSRSISGPFQIYFKSFQSILIQNQKIWTRSWCYFHCLDFRFVLIRQVYCLMNGRKWVRSLLDIKHYWVIYLHRWIYCFTYTHKNTQLQSILLLSI